MPFFKKNVMDPLLQDLPEDFETGSVDRGDVSDLETSIVETTEEVVTESAESGVPVSEKPSSRFPARKKRRFGRVCNFGTTEAGGDTVENELFSDAQNRPFALVPPTRNIGKGIEKHLAPVIKGGKEGPEVIVQGSMAPTQNMINDAIKVVPPTRNGLLTAEEVVHKVNPDYGVETARSYILGSSNYYGVEDKVDTLPPFLPASNQIAGSTTEGKKRKRILAQRDLQEVQRELSSLNEGALTKAREFGEALTILVQTKNENPYVKYAILVAMNMQISSMTYVEKSDTNQIITEQQRRVDETLSRIRRLASCTSYLTREHVFDGMKVQYLLPGQPGGLIDSLRVHPGEAPLVYEKPERIVPESSHRLKTTKIFQDTFSETSGGADPDDIDTVSMKQYDINTDNEHVKEQLAALMTEMMENMNVIRAAREGYLTRNRKSYEELITPALRVKTESVTESALTRIGRAVLQKYTPETLPGDFYVGGEVISELCSHLITNSTGRNILATAVASQMIREQIDIRSVSQTVRKRNDIIDKNLGNIRALARYLETNQSALSRSVHIQTTHRGSGGRAVMATGSSVSMSRPTSVIQRNHAGGFVTASQDEVRSILKTLGVIGLQR